MFGGNSFQYLSTEQTRVRTKKRCTKNTLRVKLVPPRETRLLKYLQNRDRVTGAILSMGDSVFGDLHSTQLTTEHTSRTVSLASQVVYVIMR